MSEAMEWKKTLGGAWACGNYSVVERVDGAGWNAEFLPDILIGVRPTAELAIEACNEYERQRTAPLKGNDSLPWPETWDGQTWAKQFLRQFKIVHADSGQPVEDQDGVMIGWMANALMRGYDRARHETAAAGRRLEPKLRESLNNLETLLCDPEGKASIRGSEADLEIINSAMSCLTWVFNNDVDLLVSLATPHAMRAIGLLEEAKNTLKMWSDAAPAVSLIRDIEDFLKRAVPPGVTAKTMPREILAGKMMDAWSKHMGKPVPWVVAVKIAGVITKMSEDEQQRLMSLRDHG